MTKMMTKKEREKYIKSMKGRIGFKLVSIVGWLVRQIVMWSFIIILVCGLLWLVKIMVMGLFGW